MAEVKTKPTEESVSGFLKTVSDKSRREDCLTVLELMKDVTGEEPKMWGSSIVGFGRYRYRYESGARRRMDNHGILPTEERPDPLHHAGLRACLGAHGSSW